MWSKPLLRRFRQSGKILQTPVLQGFAAFHLARPGYRHGTPKAGALPTALHPVIYCRLERPPHSIPYSAPVFKSFLCRRPQKVCRTTIHLGQLNKKGMRNRASCVKVKLPHKTFRKETIFLMSKSITQDMAYRQSLMKYANSVPLWYGPAGPGTTSNKILVMVYWCLQVS